MKEEYRFFLLIFPGKWDLTFQILFFGKNLLSAENALSVVNDNSQMSVRKTVLQNYAFPEQWIYLLYPVQ